MTCQEAREIINAISVSSDKLTALHCVKRYGFIYSVDFHIYPVFAILSTSSFERLHSCISNLFFTDCTVR